MQRESRTRHKAPRQYIPGTEASPVKTKAVQENTHSIPEAVNNNSVTESFNRPNAAVISSAAQKKETNQKRSRKLITQEAEITENAGGIQENGLTVKPSSLRFEKGKETRSSSLKFNKSKPTQKYMPFAQAATTLLKPSHQTEEPSQKDFNSANDILKAAESTAFKTGSLIQRVQPRPISRTSIPTQQLQGQSLRQQSGIAHSAKVSPHKSKNLVMHFLQKQRIKLEYAKALRVSSSLKTSSTQKTAKLGLKKVVEKATQLVRSRAGLYASLVLVLLLLVGSVATFAFSATTFMGGSIVGGLAESIRGSEGMVEVARSQLGQVGGEPYWSWYGFPSRVEWCAIFVSWVADQNGLISEGLFPKFAGCSFGESWFKSNNLWQDRGYCPAPGEIIFYDWDGDAFPDHVGIVESCDGSTVYTIEGNWADSVHTDSYPVNNHYIFGYGTPEYYE